MQIKQTVIQSICEKCFPKMNHRVIKVLFFLLPVACSAATGDQWTRPWNAYPQPSALGGLREFDREFNVFPFAFDSPKHIPGSGQQYPVSQGSFAPNFVSPKNVVYHNAPNNPQRHNVNVVNKHVTVHNAPRNNLNPHPYAPSYMESRVHGQKYFVPSAPAPSLPIKYPSAPVKYPNIPVHSQNTQTKYPIGSIKYPNNPKKYSSAPILHYPNTFVQQAADRYKGNVVPLKTLTPNIYSTVNGRNTAFRPYAHSSSYIKHAHTDDPVLQKIIKDVDANEKRLQKNEKVPQNHPSENHDEIGENNKNILRNQPHENFVPQYEHYFPQKMPTYYQKPKNQVNYANLDKYVVYPRPNFENVKIHPNAFQPLKNRLSALKKDQGKAFGSDKNEYPAIRPADEENDEAEDHDIFDRQKTVFDNQNQNFNKNFNQFVNQHYPNAPTLPKRLDYSEDEDDSPNDEKFVPVKMYAQVRHTETTKHLPRESAFKDAVTYEDIINAPRLREAIKTSKAQIVYSEEGYEDGAYDHAGHTKHASNHEGHGGFLNSNHKGSGLYSNSDGHLRTDGGRSENGFDESHGTTWSDDEGNNEEFEDDEDYTTQNGQVGNNDHDLIEAGSEKTDMTNTNFKPKQYFKENHKLVMSGSVEKRYEDILRADDEKKKNENRKSEDEKPEFVGVHLKKALEFNYGPEVWNIDNVSKVKSNDQFPAQSDVEVFSASLKSNDGPKHGGNYKHIQSIEKDQQGRTGHNKLSKRNSWLRGNSNDSPNDKKVTEPVDPFGETSDQPQRYSEKIIPEKYGSSFIAEENKLKQLRAEISPKTVYIPENNRKQQDDQYPNNSEVEVFTSEFKINRGPKHGGNYKKYSPGEKRKKKQEASELDDLNSSHDSSGGYLHGGNYRTARDAAVISD